MEKVSYALLIIMLVTGADYIIYRA